MRLARARSAALVAPSPSCDGALPEGRYPATLCPRPEGFDEVEIAVGRPRLAHPDDEMQRA